MAELTPTPHIGAKCGEIAERVQISDQHYFSSLFLERVGMRPKDYRKVKREK